MTRRGWALFIAMAVIWGIPYLLIKIAVGQITPLTLVFARTAIGALLLIPLAAARGELAPLLPYWRMLLASTAAGTALGPALGCRAASTQFADGAAGGRRPIDWRAAGAPDWER
jgi:drug/metabolite transporter (DMT)-like permease